MNSPAVATCPRCQRGLTDAEVASLNGQRLARRRTRSGPVGNIAPCKYCGTKMNVRERRAHEPHCPAKFGLTEATKKSLAH